MELSSMRSSLCCLNFREPSGPLIWGRNLATWKCSHETKGYCEHFVKLTDSRRHSRRLYLHGKLSALDGNLMRDQGCSSKCQYLGRPCMRVSYDIASEKVQAKGAAASRRPKVVLKGLPVLALTLNTILSCQSAYADFKPSLPAGVQVEVISNADPSVESILAKQLVRRFREMSDEELADILQQLLEASRSSASSHSHGGDGTLPENLFISNEKVLDEKPADSILKKSGLKVPKDDEKAEKSNRFMNMLRWGSEPADKERDSKADQKISDSGLNPQARDENAQVAKKTGERLIDPITGTEEEQKGWPKDTIFTEWLPRSSQVSKPQENNGEGNTALSEFLPRTSPGDAPETSNIGMPDTALEASPEVELSTIKPGANAKEDNFTRILWEEWNKRLGQKMKESDSGPTSNDRFNIKALWRSVQNFGVTVVMKVRPLCDRVFGKYKLVTFGTTWAICVVLAFYLGRFHDSSKKSVSEGNEVLKGLGDILNVPSSNRANNEDCGQGFTCRLEAGPGSKSKVFEENLKMHSESRNGEYSFATDKLAKTRESSIKGSQSQAETWWKSRDGILTERVENLRDGDENLTNRDETSARSTLDTNDLSGMSVPRTIGKSTSKARHPKYELLHHSNDEISNSVALASNVEEAFHSKAKQFNDTQHGKEAMLSVIHPDIGSSGLQSSQSQPHLNMSPAQLKPDMVHSDNHTMLERASGSTDNDLDLDLSREMASVEVCPNVISRDKVSDVELSEMSKSQIHVNQQRQAGDFWEKTLSRMTVSGESSKPSNWVDNSEHESTSPSGHSNGSCRDIDSENTIKSETDLNSFVHDKILWVRDADGVYVQEPYTDTETVSSKFVSSSVTWDMHDSTSSKAENNMENVERRDPPSTSVQKDLRRRFDYRQLLLIPENSHY